MHLSDYQRRAHLTKKYRTRWDVIYPAMGLAGEAGECVEVVKKGLRDGEFDEARLKAELGDVLWYVAMLAHDMGWDLNEVAEQNLAKLADRQQRGVLSGSGDDR